MISRLLEVKPSLISVCEELGWNAQTRTNFQWRQFEITEKLLLTICSAHHSKVVAIYSHHLYGNSIFDVF